jgi:hypothetical protein
MLPSPFDQTVYLVAFLTMAFGSAYVLVAMDLLLRAHPEWRTT